MMATATAHVRPTRCLRATHWTPWTQQWTSTSPQRAAAGDLHDRRHRTFLARAAAKAKEAPIEPAPPHRDDEVWCDPRRVRVRNDVPLRGDGPVVYWCSRDQRVDDNWALLHALSVAKSRNVPVAIVFVLVPSFASASARQYAFMLRGLREMAKTCEATRLPFHLVRGDANPAAAAAAAATRLDASLVVTDFSPLRAPREWRNDLSDALKRANVTVHEVDAHNVVPVWEASNKREYAARTIRPRITKRLAAFLTSFPTRDAVRDAALAAAASPRATDVPTPERVDWDALIADARGRDGGVVPETLHPTRRKPPGEAAARRALVGGPDAFLPSRLAMYDKRNDPNVPRALSGLSPYLHFGQLSAQRVALETNAARTEATAAAADAFVEEVVVRSELSDNYCFHEPNYDNINGASGWAIESLRLHAEDARDPAYSLEELESGSTRDELWNAAQLEMVHFGAMHGFLRMYWAKKILEWTAEGPEVALERAIYLNDKYQLDGRDSNGYVGCMWAICGVHDNAWKERDVFGKIRYMNYNGCKRKFKIDEYVERIEREVREQLAAQSDASSVNVE